jgi:hypothetical protein
MSANIATFAICFAIGGFMIPIYAPGLVVSKYLQPHERAIAAFIFLLWAWAVSYGVAFFVQK